MDWSLVIHEDADMAQLVADIVSAALEIEVVQVSNLDDANGEISDHGRRHCQLIVSSLSPPADADSARPLDRARPTSNAFLQQIRGKGDEPHCVFLLSVSEGARADELRNVQNVTLLRVADMYRQLPQIAHRAVFGDVGAETKPPHEVDVDITLINGRCQWNMRGTPTNPVEAAGMIDISRDALSRLLNDSSNAGAANHKSIGQLGLDMYLNIMANGVKTDSSLEMALRRYIRHPSYLEAARFRFHVDHETSQLMVETLAKPLSQKVDAELEFWMCRTPIFRKFGGHGERQPLFKDRASRKAPVACLIIQGDAEGFSAGGELAKGFPGIPQAAQETDALETYFRNHDKDFRLAPLKVMRPNVYPDGGYGNAVRRALVEQRWQLIHYVGHSAIGRDGKGYLALGGSEGDLIDIDDFAARAAHAQFVFLNSCQSANATFIMKLVEKKIPAVAGYAWPIDDTVAKTFSRNFYEELFDGAVSKRFLEYAFMRAKSFLYLNRAYQATAVWTSPILFMQLLDAEPDQAAPRLRGVAR